MKQVTDKITLTEGEAIRFYCASLAEMFTEQAEPLDMAHFEYTFKNITYPKKIKKFGTYGNIKIEWNKSED